MRALITLLASVTLAYAQSPVTDAPPSPPGHVRALLVGVTDYPLLKDYYANQGHADRYNRIRLQGPANDVQRMRDTVTTVLEATPDQVHTLTGWPADETARPNRANIERELQRLAKESGKGDLVIVYLSGHGTQVPDLNGDEADGLDEAFLPADVAVWDGKAGHVPGAILDDDLAIRIAGIRASGARVWLIVDACFSGTMLRGEPGSERLRSLEPELLGIPPATGAPRPTARTMPADLDVLGDGVTAMYAVISYQRAVEDLLPPGSKDYHGLFTWHLTQQLSRNGPGETFGELHQQVITAIAASGRRNLTPTIEGKVDATILGGARTGMLLQIGRGASGLFVNGGAIMGLRVKDRLSVYASGRRGEAESCLGQVEVTSVGPLQSAVKPVADSTVAESALSGPDQLLPAELSQTSVDLRRLRLTGAGPTDEPLLARLVQWTNDPKGTDGSLTLAEDGSGVLTPTGGQPLQFATGGLLEMVYRLHRARNLGQLMQSTVLARMPHGLDVRFEINNGTDKLDGWRLLGAGETVAPGCRGRLVVVNKSQRDWDIYCFCLASDLELLLVAKVQAEGSDKQPHTSTELRFNDKTLGREQVVMFVVPGGAPSLASLANTAAQAMGAERGPSVRHLIRDVTAGLDTGASRGLGSADDAIACMRAIPYTVTWGHQPVANITIESLLGGLRKFGTGTWTPAPDSARPRSLGDVYQQCAPAVVAIRNQLGYGTGFFIDRDRGLILTNHHVVAAGHRVSKRGLWLLQILVGKLDQDGMMRLERSDIEAEVIAMDEHRDLALLQVVGPLDWLKDRPVLSLEDKPPVPGRDCAILGHPAAGMLWSFRDGRISALGSFPHDEVENVMRTSSLTDADRAVAMSMLEQAPAVHIMMTTCGANHGDSGGPVVNEHGKVIGVTFAVPSDPANKEFTYHIRVDEVRAFMKTAPAADAELPPWVPDGWHVGSKIAWHPDDPTLGVGALWGQEDEYYNSVMLDFDGDSKLGEVDGSTLSRVLRLAKRPFDFEMAIQITPCDYTVYYDTDGDGEFDLVLMDTNRDMRADAEFTKSDGKWSYTHGSRRDLLQLSSLGGQYLKTDSKEYERASAAVSALLK